MRAELERAGRSERTVGARRKVGRLSGIALAVIAAFGATACASTGDPLADLGPEELWSIGIEAFEDGDWSDAIEAFERLVNRNPGHPRNPEARMHTAQAYMEQGDYVMAADDYERFLRLHPGHGLASQASLGVCRAYAELAPHPQRDQRYTRRARDACGRTILEYPLLDVAEEAAQIREDMIDLLAERAYEEARFYQRRDAHNSAIVLFEEVADQYEDTRWGPLALLAMYRSYRDLGWTEEAVETAERLLAQHPDSEPADRLRQEDGFEELLGSADGAAAEDGP